MLVFLILILHLTYYLYQYDNWRQIKEGDEIVKMRGKIKNKQESARLIKELDLNRVEERIFTKQNLNELNEFLESTNYDYYNLRDKSKAGGNFLYKKTKEEILEESKSYETFSVYESLYLADENLILQGDIFINDKFEMVASLDDRKNLSLREATKEPRYSLKIDLKLQKEPAINGLTEIIDYITMHELFNCYVEISYFGIPVGIHKEPFIVWELRNY